MWAPSSLFDEGAHLYILHGNHFSLNTLYNHHTLNHLLITKTFHFHMCFSHFIISPFNGIFFSFVCLAVFVALSYFVYVLYCIVLHIVFSLVSFCLFLLFLFLLFLLCFVFCFLGFLWFFCPHISLFNYIFVIQHQ